MHLAALIPSKALYFISNHRLEITIKGTGAGYVLL